MKSDRNIEIYGSFLVGELEVALNVNSIQEVVNFPEKIIKMPLAPDFLVGVFNLRGLIIPVINLKSLLEMKETEISSQEKIGIVEYEGVRVGLLFDSTNEIIRINRDDLSEFTYGAGQVHNVIAGAIKLDEGRRIVQVVNPFALISIENIPQIAEQQNKITAALKHQKNSVRKKCITFSSGNINLGMEITSIHEIIKFSDIQTSAIKTELCLGMVNLRGQTVPVIDLSILLGEKATHVEAVNDKRIIILKIEQGLFGLLVDRVESISTYQEDEILPIPLLSKKRSSVFAGCVVLAGIGDVILLNSSQILTNDEVKSITQGHSKIYDSAGTDSAKQMAKGTRRTYISFKLDYLLGVSIQDVREIISFSSDIVTAPGMPDYVYGILNLRGTVVTIINTRSLYSMTMGQKEKDQTKILIFESEGERFGLIVDSVETIISIDDSKKMKVPSLMVQKAEDQFKNDIAEIVTYQQDDEKEGVLIILNMEPLFSRITNKIAA